MARTVAGSTDILIYPRSHPPARWVPKTARTLLELLNLKPQAQQQEWGMGKSPPGDLHPESYLPHSR